ncbi:unnamed protein product [Mucor hiemalis]
MNYTGDCLNFGLAVERAKARGIKVDLITVGDDVAVGRSKGDKVGRRGMAATALAIKLAGALAARGASLEQVKAMVQYTIDHSATLGMAFDHCHVPGNTAGASLAEDELELGMGIHNETGFLKTKMMSANDLVSRMMHMLVDKHDPERSYLSVNNTSSVVLLVNNLGGIAQLELNLVVKSAVEYLLHHEVTLKRVLVGPFLTSLNMPGFSITLLQVKDDNMLELLDQPVSIPGWPSAPAIQFSNQILGEYNAKSPKETKKEDELMGKVDDTSVVEKAIRGAAEAVITAEPRITEYDTVLGDGDCGQTLKTAALAILDALSTYDLQSSPETILGIADTIEHSVGGTSSAIYCIFFNALAGGLLKQPRTNATVWVTAARHALSTLMTYTKARIGDRTLMDTLCPFIDTLNDDASNTTEALEAAQKGCQNTCDMTAQLGRSSYLSNEKVLQSGIPDAGAYGLNELLHGLFTL